MILKRSIQNARILNFCEASRGWCRGDGGKGGKGLIGMGTMGTDRDGDKGLGLH